MAAPAPASVPLPALALPPRPARWRGLWLLPLVLSLLMVAGVLVWLRQAEQAEQDEQRQALITDSLSLEAQIGAYIDTERQRLEDVARRLDAHPPTADDFDSMPEVLRGLRRFWISVTWLDAQNRLLAQVPEQAPLAEGQRRPLSNGLSAHISAPLASGGTLVARYSPGDMLRQNVPWWLARKYDVRLVDSAGDVIASTMEGGDLDDRETYRITMAPRLQDTWLELIARDRIRPWYRTLPVALIGGFIVLVVLATLMLRRQMRSVSRAEQAWRTEAAWRSAMEESLTVGLRARDLDGRILYVNRALADMLDYPPEALVGLLPPMPYWPPDALDETLQRHQRNLAGHAPREGYEATWMRRDGRRIDVMLFEAPLVDANGRHVGWMGSILDITERKRLEERERHQAEAMAHHSRLTMLGEVASTLAHELNQPLTAIASYGAGVLNSLQRQPAPDPMVLRALQRLGEQAAHAGAIVQRIREFLTRREPRLESCDINAVVNEATRLLQRELQRQQVTLSLRLDERLQPIVADGVLVEQVVINLVRNAGDALASHAADTRRIEVATSRSADGRFARIDVCDNGPGLQGRTIDMLCQPFYSTKAEGMGMGLAICRSILEAHHGVFDASEARGGGACFSLTLPVDLDTREEADELPEGEDNLAR
jgi:two-component system sensor histidine kinase DctS